MKGRDVIGGEKVADEEAKVTGLFAPQSIWMPSRAKPGTLAP